MEHQAPTTVKDFLYQNIQILTGLAMYHLDALPVQSDEFQGMTKDLKEAQLAIDSIKGLLDALRDRITPQERSGIESLLRDLQLRFVEKKRLA